MRLNPVCKAFAERLEEKGKPSIVIIAAIMTRLLHLIYGVLKSEKPSKPDILKKAPITPLISTPHPTPKTDSKEWATGHPAGLRQTSGRSR
jgi:hypothetical protein